MLGETEAAPMDHSATAGGVENVAGADRSWPFRDVDWGISQTVNGIGSRFVVSASPPPPGDHEPVRRRVGNW